MNGRCWLTVKLLFLFAPPYVIALMAQPGAIVYEGPDPLAPTSNTVLYSIGPDGSGKQILKVGPIGTIPNSVVAGLGNPRWSRDGSRITAVGVACTSQSQPPSVNCAGQTALDVFTFAPTGGQAQQITNFGQLSPVPYQVWSAFSPDGQNLAVSYLYTKSPPDGSHCFATFVYSIDGRLINTGGGDCVPAGSFAWEGWGIDWSPQGNVFLTPASMLQTCPGILLPVIVTEIEVTRATASGLQSSALTPHCTDIYANLFSYDYDVSPVFSPNGAQVAFVRLTSFPLTNTGNTSIRIINLDGTNEREVVSFQNEQTYRITWSPDGSQLLFDRGAFIGGLTAGFSNFGSFGLWTINVDGSNLKPLPNANKGGAPSWNQIVCTYSINSGSVMLAAGGGAGSVSVSAPGGCSWSATSNAPWLVITSGNAGSGTGTVNYTVAANTAPSSRMGSLTIGGQNFTVTQAGAVGGFTINKIHTGNLMLGQQSATYTVTVSNSVNSVATTGVVTVTEIVPSGLTLVSMAGPGWNCSLSACTRSDTLPAGASYSPITVTVNVALNATSPQINQVSVSGGGLPTATASDPTIIGVNQPTLVLSRKTVTFGYSGTLITDPQTVALNFINGSVAWTASSNQSNITVSPTLGNGSVTLQITANAGASGVITITAPGAANSPQQIQVNISNVAIGAPFGSFDTPLNNTAGIAGAIPVTGWTLDNIAVTSVFVSREPIGNEPTQPNGLVFIGNGTFVAGARPDVEATYPSAPLNYRAGWGYMLLTNFLPNSDGSAGRGNGTYKLHAIATNKAGMTLDLGTRTITVDNAHASKPFGTIDTPGQGGTVSGNAYINFGWALTQNPYAISIDGSTLTVYIDSLPVGHPTYNQYRSDIATLFPGLANSNGAVGFYYIDTTKLSNGVHTIAWSAYDNANRGDGIGSRYFTVSNTGTGNMPGVEGPMEITAKHEIMLRRGFDASNAVELLAQDASGAYAVETEELGRIELRVGALAGHMLVNGETRALPVGSSLKNGVFYWHPGPGFLGEYQLQFDLSDGTFVRTQVTVLPKAIGEGRVPQKW